MHKPKISIITINLNNTLGLQRTIESVITQTYSNIEYIVIDGNSTDGSVGVIKEHLDSISYWISEKDSGIYNAMNKGIAKATGDYLLFLNSGDILAEINVLQNVFNQQREAAVLYGDMIVDYGNKEEKKNAPEKIDLRHLIRDTVWHPCSFIRSDLFKKYGNYSEGYSIASDYRFFLQLFLSHESFEYINECIAVFCFDGISSNEISKQILLKERFTIQEEIIDKNVLELYKVLMNDIENLSVDYRKLRHDFNVLENHIAFRIVKGIKKIFFIKN